MRCQLLRCHMPSNHLYLKTKFNACSLPQVVKSDDVFEKAGIGWPHTSHCLANGQVMISGMGTKDGSGKGNAIHYSFCKTNPINFR